MRRWSFNTFVLLCLFVGSGCAPAKPVLAGAHTAEEVRALEAIPALAPDDDPDRDGIPNIKDGAPLEAEDADGFEDEDGIPDPIHPGQEPEKGEAQADAKPEGEGAEEASEGPEKGDEDGDGVVDAYDLCLTALEDIDGFEDDDGCPEADNDGDGILDDADPCPLAWGEKCSDKKLLETEARIEFASGSAKLDAERSKTAFDQLIVLIKKERVKRLEVRCHTDSRTKNTQRLSEQRAEAVKKHLVGIGLKADRITTKGMGSTEPVASDDTSDGRALNNRVEFIVVESREK